MTRYARCTFDGRPAHPDDAKVIADFTATLQARRGNPALRWRERAGNPLHGPYWREWYCEPPARGYLWQSLREEWLPPGEGGWPVRRIYEIEVSRATSQATGEGGRAGPGGVRAGPGPGTPAADPGIPPGAPPQGAG